MRNACELPSGQLLSIRQPGATVTCVVGHLWVTQVDDPEDHIVEAGNSYTIHGWGRVTVQALADSLIQLNLPATPRPRLRARWRLLRQRLHLAAA